MLICDRGRLKSWVASDYRLSVGKRLVVPFRRLDRHPQNDAGHLHLALGNKEIDCSVLFLIRLAGEVMGWVLSTPATRIISRSSLIPLKSPLHPGDPSDAENGVPLPCSYLPCCFNDITLCNRYVFF